MAAKSFGSIPSFIFRPSNLVIGSSKKTLSANHFQSSFWLFHFVLIWKPKITGAFIPSFATKTQATSLILIHLAECSQLKPSIFFLVNSRLIFCLEKMTVSSMFTKLGLCHFVHFSKFNLLHAVVHIFHTYK